ncbi:cornifelin homolog B [Eurytemora carolleeae]|uniref:cornifelin homolog B n=1 Tax=Eurytemora carolleeae TaxID=1294199 RepID=UPI000C78B853|nr:cornifelin homolog B [Eurytemora carolleeae]|eukprot:XP_023348241.1 cornifelin homolog B-like [Eurytemora affinis]
MSKEWNAGTFSCCHDVSNCCMGTFCTPCQVYSNAEKLEESGFLCCLLSCMLPCVPIFMLRSKTREKHNIEVDFRINQNIKFKLFEDYI